jgi:uncharacterized protein (TIGR02996 family)
MKGFIDEIMAQHSDEATWLIMADYLDEREIPHRIREFRKFQELAINHKKREKSSSKQMRMLQRIGRQKQTPINLCKDYATLWALLCARRWVWDILPEECVKPLLTAELAWCGLVKEPQLATQNVYMNGLKRNYAEAESKEYLTSIVADIIWGMVDDSATNAVYWMGLVVTKISNLMKRQKWCASLGEKIMLQTKRAPSL